MHFDGRNSVSSCGHLVLHIKAWLVHTLVAQHVKFSNYILYLVLVRRMIPVLL